MDTVHENLCMYVYDNITLNSFQNKKCFSRRENKIHILCQTTFPEDRIIYEIIQKNIAQPDRPQITI
jgi:hypothetical protein